MSVMLSLRENFARTNFKFEVICALPPRLIVECIGDSLDR